MYTKYSQVINIFMCVDCDNPEISNYLAKQFMLKYDSKKLCGVCHRPAIHFEIKETNQELGAGI